MTCRAPNAGDAGAVTVILLLLSGAFLAFAGLVWDGGRAITARQHAADLAEQAARCRDVEVVGAGKASTPSTRPRRSPTPAGTCASPH